MHSGNLSRRAFLFALFLFLVVSVASVASIPFLRPWGADFHTVLVYQQCGRGDDPYALSPKACGEMWNRGFVYPPVLFHSFFWLRWLNLERAMWVWSLFTVVALGFVLYAWTRHVENERPGDADWEIWLFCILLLFEYPCVFALERGGTDLGAVVLWTGVAWLFAGNRLFLAGLCAGLAAAYKLYPGIGAAIVGVALVLSSLRQGWPSRKQALLFGGGAVGAFVVSNAAFPHEAMIYFKEVLPPFAAARAATSVYAHSIPSFCAGHDGFANALSLALAALWVWACKRGLSRDPAMSLAGALAVSTYFAGTSYDYNSITAYPLLLLLFLRARRAKHRVLLGLGLIAIVGPRQWFDAPDAHVMTPLFHLALQVAWLVLVAVDLGGPPAQDAPPAQRAGASAVS